MRRSTHGEIGEEVVDDMLHELCSRDLAGGKGEVTIPIDMFVSGPLIE